MDKYSNIPCDMILLDCENEERICHVTTANLDGETNLKVKLISWFIRFFWNFQLIIKKKVVPSEFPKFKDLSYYRGVIKCDKPNMGLYEFKGIIQIDDEKMFVQNT